MSSVEFTDNSGEVKTALRSAVRAGVTTAYRAPFRAAYADAFAIARIPSRDGTPVKYIRQLLPENEKA